MKTSTILLGASAAFVAAQTDFPAGFPQCGVTCITNMLAKSGTEFNCGAQDIQCLCSKANFLYGVRDCADQACSDTAQADAVKQVGLSYCANAGVAVSGISYTGSISATVSPTTTIFAGDAPATTTTTATESEGSSGAGSASGASSTAISTVFSESTDSAGSTTSVPVSTIFSDAAGAAVSTVAVSTVFSESTDSAGSTTSVPVSTIYSTASLSESTITGTTTGTETNTVSNESTTLTATQTSTGTTLSTSTGTSRPSGSSSSSSAFAAQQTVGPAGLIAVAGMGIAMMF